MRPFRRFIGVDLGGARGKTTAVATAELGDGCLIIESVASRSAMKPWTDDVLLNRIRDFDPDSTVVAIDAPLTTPACLRCSLEACPGASVCDVPAVAWLRSRSQLDGSAADVEGELFVANRSNGMTATARSPLPDKGLVLAPYTHRCTEVALHFDAGVYPREHLGQGVGPLAARGNHLRRVLRPMGYSLNHNLIEVSPRATVHALFGGDAARGYKRDADPWLTRASIVEGMAGSVRFGPRSRLAREDVLQNDHCFDALLTAYTAYLYSRDEWVMPADQAELEDGWIWAPPRAD